MAKAKFKYNGSGTHRRAILFMIGQSLEVFKEAATVRDIAGWMNLSKVTARKYLKRMIDNEELQLIEQPYKNTVIHKYMLSQSVRADFYEGRLTDSYHIYAQRVMRVMLQ